MRSDAPNGLAKQALFALAIGVYVGLVAAAPSAGAPVVVALLVAGAATALYVGRLRARVRALSVAVDALDASRAEHRETMSDLERAGRTDEATGLGNRRRLEAALPRLVTDASSSMSSLAVLVLDLDGLADHRARHGALACDLGLRDLAAEWQGQMRINDVLVRVSDEEFVAVLPACSPPNARRVAERLAASAPNELACRVGVASWDGIEGHDQLLARAESATREAADVGEPVRAAL